MSTPASLACCWKSVAASTIPGAAVEVCSFRVSPLPCPASASRAFAFARSRVRCGRDES